MSGYLLDTNHLAAALDVGSPTYRRIFTARHGGERVGTCAPVLCELSVGIRQTGRRGENWQLLSALLKQVRIWPLDLAAAAHYAEIYSELRGKGRVLSQVDMMVAALARRDRTTIVTTDRDFEALPDLTIENWIADHRT